MARDLIASRRTSRFSSRRCHANRHAYVTHTVTPRRDAHRDASVTLARVAPPRAQGSSSSSSRKPPPLGYVFRTRRARTLTPATTGRGIE